MVAWPPRAGGGNGEAAQVRAKMYSLREIYDEGSLCPTEACGHSGVIHIDPLTRVFGAGGGSGEESQVRAKIYSLREIYGGGFLCPTEAYGHSGVIHIDPLTRVLLWGACGVCRHNQFLGGLYLRNWGFLPENPLDNLCYRTIACDVAGCAE